MSRVLQVSACVRQDVKVTDPGIERITSTNLFATFAKQREAKVEYRMDLFALLT